MSPYRINEAMAKLDGWKLVGKHGFKWESEGGTRFEEVHSYVKDLNLVARVVSRLSAMDRIVYRSELGEICGQVQQDPIDAAAPQRCEAVLRATANWES